LKKYGFTNIRTSGRQTTLDSFSGKKESFAKNKDIFGLGGGVCDSYQPVEKEYQLTRKVLEILRDYEIPIHVITKSDLILRDLDLYKKINETSWCNVSFTITTLDEKLANIFEPRASSPKARISALKTFKDNNIQTGITFMPIIPFILDNDDNIENVIKNAKEIGCKYILAAGMTLKPGRQKDHFLSVIKSKFPELLSKFEDAYSNLISPNRKTGEDLYKKVQEEYQEHQCSCR